MAAHGESARREGPASLDDPLSAGLSGALVNGEHRLIARVYYADTDFSGVVYHGRYLEFFERGRSDFLRLAGVHHTELDAGLHGERLIWIVRRMEIDFRAPARIDDVLEIRTGTLAISGARITMHQAIRREEALLVEARVEAAIIGADGRPRRFPKNWIAAFLPEQAG